MMSFSNFTQSAAATLRRLAAGFLLVGLTTTVFAQEKPALPVAVRVTHVEQDTWRIDYTFPQAINALKMDTVADYRTKAWKVLTPGLRLVTDGAAQQDMLTAGGKPFKSLSVQVTTFATVLPKNYMAVDRFSDGGRMFYLGFLQGDAEQRGTVRAIKPRFTLVGLGAETTIAPPSPVGQVLSDSAYAYFGPARPVKAGGAQVIIDPRTPAWVTDTILDATAKMSTHYATTYQRTLRQPLVLLVALADTETPGLSIKGGAMGAQIAYRLSGNALLTDDPKIREYIAKLVAHEMAHVWQQNVARGGIGADTPWVHEGGAEAMALEGVVSTGLWKAADGEAFTAKTLKTCDQLGHTVDTYDGIYACGFERYHQLRVGTVPLWRALMAHTERTGEPYSEAMIASVAKEHQK
jgi:hypothetical protein